METEPSDVSRDRDDELVQAVLNAPEGDLRAFEQLIDLYQKRILADCQFLTRDHNNAEDLAQEVFVKVFFGLPRFEGRSSFRHWLQRIKVNHCLNHIKKRDGKGSLAIDDEAVEMDERLRVPAVAAKEVEAKEDHLLIEGILNSMPATLRVPLIMCDMDELSYEEIAAALSIGLSAVKMRIKRAREHFRRVYEGGGAAAGQAAR